MRTDHKLGLVAIAIVIGLFAAIGGVVAIAAKVGGHTTSLADRPLSSGDEKDDESYVRGHRFWRKELSAAKLDELVKLVVATEKDAVVYIDLNGRHEVVAPIYKGIGPHANKLDKAYFAVRCVWDKRPTREQVVRSMRSGLDDAEYRHGAGR